VAKLTSSDSIGSDLRAAELIDAEAISALDSQAILTLELAGIKLIEASAGTGKTHTIADLYLRHILTGRLTSQILIVTYTNAATEELRGRIQNRLYQALTLITDSLTNDTPTTDFLITDGARSTDSFLQQWQQQWQALDEEQQTLQLARLQLALRSLDEACISTIHSFCQRSLQEHALAGNQHFETELLSDDSPLWDAATKDWWRSLSYDLDRDTWLLLRNSLGSVDKLIRAILELRNKPSANLLPRGDETLETLLARPRQIAADLYQLAPRWLEQKAEIVEIVRDTKVLSRAKKLPYHVDNFDAWIDAADYFFNASEAGPLFEHFEYLGAVHLEQHSKPSQRGKDSRLDHDFFRAVSDVAQRWVEFGQTFGPLLCIDAFRQVSRSVVEHKREMATLAFQDQLSLLLEALDSASGATLARSLRQQYPVAMIDEFQDTDSIQYRIFGHIYHAIDADADDSSLTLIGDPKQAIYSFRGGDIFTYMQARKLPTIKRYNLYTNWRSQPDLVKAVNTLFALRPDAFVFRDSIDFHAVESIPDNQRYRLLLNQRPTPAMTLWKLPQPLPNDNQKDNYTRAEMRDAINQAIVIEITSLLQAAREGAASIDGKALQSGDIAILVRQASEGHALSHALRQHGIRTVTIGRDSVFNSDEARGLYDLLLAVVQCQDPAIAARSLASNLLHLDYRQIAAVVDSDRAWQRWLEDLADLQNLWLRHGFIAMFQSLLHGFDITRQLALLENSERRLTNLLHLAELLQQQSKLAAGMTPLLRWFQEQFEESAGEDAELRLEDDQALVKIVTIHKSKGLQYPIVFVPFLWSCRPIDRNQPIYFHDADLAACIDLGSKDSPRHWMIAEKERLAEDLRLLYVAVTRARSRLYLAWGLAGSPGKTGYANQTALAYLLHSQQTPEDLDSQAPDGLPDAMDFGADLQSLVDKSEATIECQPLPGHQAPLALYCDESTRPAPQLAQFKRIQPMQWRVNSFTALTRAVHQPPGQATKTSEQDPILDFPAGSHVGLLLHSLLENLDFRADIATQCAPLFNRFLSLAGLSSEHQQTLVLWLTNILETPLDGASLTLSGIDNRQRLNELAFDFALDHLDLAALNRFMQARVARPLQALGGADFRGLITGVIDLVFEYQGRYYLADYKSNLLGGELQDYTSDKLEQAMLDRRYDLQSLIYALALHRLLAQRLPAYDYEQHFGGSYYLFLRAMRPEKGCRYGIHFERPQRIVIEQFDDLFRFTPPRDTSA
jgi:exodeoxyribonuclease V beta subunit